jgi:AraC-like DNA-binding protein
MKRILLVTLWTIVSFNCQSHFEEKFNFQFDSNDSSKFLSYGWKRFGGDYHLSIDSFALSGSKSGKITSKKSKHGFGAMVYMLPAKYKGKSIRLEGYMRIKNVEDGHAGLILRIDDADIKVLEFNNMTDQKITGTRGWRKYSITLPYPEDAHLIWVGGILSGEGEAWFDDFKVTIDGFDIQLWDHLNSKIYIPWIQLKLLQSNYPVKNISFKLMWGGITTFLLLVIGILLRKTLSNENRARLKAIFWKEHITQLQYSNRDLVLEEQNVFLKDEKEQEIICALEKIIATNYHLESECSLHNVAKKIKTNTSYLSRAVNKNYNKTFSEYISELRFEYVTSQMIANPTFRKYSTQAIAESAGYKSAVSFTRAFKKRTGVTPTQFAENIEDT